MFSCYINLFYINGAICCLEFHQDIILLLVCRVMFVPVTLMFVILPKEIPWFFKKYIWWSFFKAWFSPVFKTYAHMYQPMHYYQIKTFHLQMSHTFVCNETIFSLLTNSFDMHMYDHVISLHGNYVDIFQRLICIVIISSLVALTPLPQFLISVTNIYNIMWYNCASTLTLFEFNFN